MYLINSIIDWVILNYKFITTILTIYVSYRGIKKQILNNPKHLYFCLKQIDPIFKNLDLLIEGLTFKGRFIPTIEHRIPTFSSEDNSNTISIAQRSHQFRTFGRKILWFCRRLKFIISKKEMPKTYNTLTEIENYLGKSKPNQKINIDIIALNIDSCIDVYTTIPPENKQKTKEILENNKNKLNELKDKLTKNIEEELPAFRNK